MPDPIVRPVRADELDAVAALMVRTYVGEGHVPASSPYVRELEAVQGRAREADLLVAVVDEAVVGTVTFCLPGTPWAEVSRTGEAEFRMLAVDRAARGAGVGRRLVQECLDRALAAAAGRMVISTTASMRDAHRMYERMGFTRLPERDWYPRPSIHLLVYGRDLGEG